LSDRAEELRRALESFEPSQGWVRLIPLVREVPDALPKPEGARLFFALFERFPEEEDEVHWMMLHYLEDVRGYEDMAVQSLSRQPSVFALRMVSRMLQAGMKSIGGKNLIEILAKIAEDKEQPHRIREDAKTYVGRNLSRSAL
jgi:hypothetical protein